MNNPRFPRIVGQQVLCQLCILLCATQSAFAGHLHSYEECIRLLESSQYDKSIAMLQEMISANPSKELWQCLGTVYFRKGDMRKAEHAFKLGLTLDQNYWCLWGGLARVLYEQGRYAESKEALAKSEQLKLESAPEQSASAPEQIASAATNSSTYKTLTPSYASDEPSPDPTAGVGLAAAPSRPKLAFDAGSTPANPNPIANEAGEPPAPNAKPDTLSMANNPKPIVKPGRAAPSSRQSPVSTSPRPKPSANNSRTLLRPSPITVPKRAPSTVQKIVRPAYPRKAFPGKGDQNTWERACKLYDRGVSCSKVGHHAYAAQKFKEAVAMYPYDPDFLRCLKLTLKRLNRSGEAEKIYHDAIALKQDDCDQPR